MNVPYLPEIKNKGNATAAGARRRSNNTINKTSVYRVAPQTEITDRYRSTFGFPCVASCSYFRISLESSSRARDVFTFVCFFCAFFFNIRTLHPPPHETDAATRAWHKTAFFARKQARPANQEATILQDVRREECLLTHWARENSLESLLIF